MSRGRNNSHIPSQHPLARPHGRRGKLITIVTSFISAYIRSCRLWRAGRFSILERVVLALTRPPGFPGGPVSAGRKQSDRSIRPGAPPSRLSPCRQCVLPDGGPTHVPALQSHADVSAVSPHCPACKCQWCGEGQTTEVTEADDIDHDPIEEGQEFKRGHAVPLGSVNALHGCHASAPDPSPFGG